MLRRRKSIEERRQRGLIAQGRVRQALGQISDPGLRRAIDALTSLENWDENTLGFTKEGRLTIDEDAVRGAVDPVGALGFVNDQLTLTLTVKLCQATSAAKNDAPIRLEGTVLKYTQLPARNDIATGTALADVIVFVNQMLADQRNAGHRARTMV